MESNFVWTDLSAHILDEAIGFYEKSFHWNTMQYSLDDENPYIIAYQGNEIIAGLYPLPEEFKEKNFPSFWMSYIHVECLEEIIDKVELFAGSKIEIPPIQITEDSRISLVRDPLGAGFTIYEGEPLCGRFKDGHGRPVWNTLHICEMEAVRDFYETLFDWKINRTEQPDQYKIKTSADVTIGNIEILPEEFRGGYQYWMPVFEVIDLSSYLDTVLTLGGKRIFTFKDKKVMIQDSQQACFLVREKLKQPVIN